MLTAEQTVTQTCVAELSRAALVALLDRAKRVVPARFPKPILMCVHLEASESLLCLQATDGELSLFAQMPVDGSLPACVVPLSERDHSHCECLPSTGLFAIVQHHKHHYLSKDR